MLKFVSMLCHWFERILEPSAEPLQHDRTWLIDPLSHPAIARMDARELADLPFPRGWRSGSARSAAGCKLDRKDGPARAAGAAGPPV